MATPVAMPKPGNTVEECFLTEWRKHKGDPVREGEVIAEIETDKASMDLTSPADGILLETFFGDGTLVPVFTTLGVIGQAGEAVEQFRPQRAPAAAAEQTARGAAEPAAGIELTGVPASPGRQPVLSPRARRFAEEHRVDLASITGSGPRGRILEADLRARFEAAQDAAPVPPAGPAVTAPAPAAEPAAPAGTRLSFARQTIARRLREGMASTVQYTVHGSANAGGLLAVRQRLKESPVTAGIGISELVAYCTIRALLAAPELNAELVDGSVHVHPEVHLAFACDTPRGLLAPVVRDGQKLSLLDLSRRMKQLAAQAVDGDIPVDDLSGGTFTISNLGSLGVESFTPVLNPPQVAILGVDAIALKPVRKPDGNIEFIDAIGLSLTVDHQLIDGAAAARFLHIVGQKIESAEALCRP